MFKRIIISSAMALGSCCCAIAAESFIPITPPGGTDLNQAILPPPGIYGILVTIPYNQDQHLYGQNGRPVPAASNLRFNIPIGVAAVAYVYPFDLAGGHLMTSVAFSYYDLHSQSPISFLNEHISGLADTYSDVFYYTKNVGLAGATPGHLPFLAYGLNLGGGVALNAPTGVYDSKLPINIGSNIWLTTPNLSATYITGPNMSFGDATAISGRVFLGLPSKNHATGYQTGNILDFDFSVSQIFGKIQGGVAGFYQEQISNDSAAGGVYVPAGGRFAYGGIGPIVQYVFDNGIIIKAKFSKNYYARGTVGEDAAIVAVATKF